MVDTVTVQADRDCHRLTEAPNVIAHGITVGGVHASMDAHLQPQHAMPLLATSPIRKDQMFPIVHGGDHALDETERIVPGHVASTAS